MIEFEESGVRFLFPDDNCYRVETDPLVIGGKEGSTSNNMACECASSIDGRVCFIEVKSSAPRKPSGNVKDVVLNGKPLPSNWFVLDNYRNYLREISKKFMDSLSIVRAIIDGRHGECRRASLALPDKTVIDLDKLLFILILNLKLPDGQTADKDGLSSLQDALKNEMRPFLNTWRIPDTTVKVVIPEDASRLLHVPILF